GHDASCVGQADAAVEIDADVAGVAEHIAGCGHAGHDLVDAAVGGDAIEAPARVHLHRREPLFETLGDRIRHLGRLVATHPAVHPDAVAHRSAQHHVHGGS